MKKILTFLAVICLTLIIVGCGKNDELVGTWEGATNDGLKTTFTFDNNNKATYKNEFNFEGKGTYKIKDDVVTITIDIWEKPKEYKFEVKDGKLSLTAKDNYSPSYKDMKKAK